MWSSFVLVKHKPNHIYKTEGGYKFVSVVICNILSSDTLMLNIFFWSCNNVITTALLGLIFLYPASSGFHMRSILTSIWLWNDLCWCFQYYDLAKFSIYVPYIVLGFFDPHLSVHTKCIFFTCVIYAVKLWVESSICFCYLIWFNNCSS